MKKQKIVYKYSIKARGFWLMDLYLEYFYVVALSFDFCIVSCQVKLAVFIVRNSFKFPNSV